MRTLISLSLLVLTGCGAGNVDLGGSLFGQAFEAPKTALHGSNFLVFVDKKLSCQDLGWVNTSYSEGSSPSATSFNAVQIALKAPITEPITLSLSTDVPSVSRPAAATALSTEGVFAVEHARDGLLVISDVTDKSLTGEISVAFAADGIGGTFTSEFCLVLDLPS